MKSNYVFLKKVKKSKITDIEQLKKLKIHFFMIASYIYKDNNEIRTFRKQKLIGLSWVVLWPIYVLRRKQYIVFTLSMTLLLTYIVLLLLHGSIEILVALFCYAIYATAILFHLSDFLFILKKKKKDKIVLKRVSKINVLPIYNVDISEKTITIENQKIKPFKVSINIILDEEENMTVKKGAYDISYTLNTIDVSVSDLFRKMEELINVISDELYKRDDKVIYIEEMINGNISGNTEDFWSYFETKIEKTSRNYRSILSRNYRTILKEITSKNPHNIKIDVIKMLSWKILINDSKRVVYSNFEEDDTHNIISKHYATFLSATIECSNFHISIVEGEAYFKK